MKVVIAAALMLAGVGMAEANGVQCPGNPGEWRDDVKWCPSVPQPQGTSFSNEANATATAGAVGVGTGVGVGIGGNQQQGQVASARTGNVTVNSRNRAAASSAIAPGLGGYGMPNCFGDTNPSGSFVAAFGNIFASASAGGMKASNICAAYAIGGEELALRYLMRMDRNMPRSIVLDVPTRVTCPATHPVYVEGRGCRK